MKNIGCTGEHLAVVTPLLVMCVSHIRMPGLSFSDCTCHADSWERASCRAEGHVPVTYLRGRPERILDSWLLQLVLGIQEVNEWREYLQVLLPFK